MKAAQRYVLALDLKDDPALIGAYRIWHQPGGPPAHVIGQIRAAGITGLEIYLTGNRLCMILEADETFSFERKAELDAGDPEVQAWEERMWAFQQALPWAGPGEKWVRMERIFDLEAAG